MLIHKELHSGGNYTLMPILKKVFPDLSLAIIKLSYGTVSHRDLCLPLVQRWVDMQPACSQYGYTDGLWILFILID